MTVDVEVKEVKATYEDKDERGNWTGKLDFFLSLVGYAVGLGNVWRFPFLCYRNGGGAFLIPYVIMLGLAGLPLFFFELSFGQFASLGPITIWRINPLFRGIGYGMVAISAMVSIYYNVIIAYAVYFMFVSFTSLDSGVPWASCNNTWNTPLCIDEARPLIETLNETEKLDVGLKWMNMSCMNNTLDYLGLSYNDLTYNLTQTDLSNCSNPLRLKTPSEEYFNNYVLQLDKTDGFENSGGLSLKLSLTLVLSWIIIFFCLKKGVKSSGKVVYFTATFPYVVLVILLIRGLTLPGYMKGITFYIIPKWESLLKIEVWGDAASQIFYSLGPAFGSLITMSSYNKFKNNCYRDAISVAIINCGTSVFAGFVIFSVLGYMAHLTNQDVADVADSGPGLVFVAYPEGIAKMPVAPLWAFLFFFMLLTLGLDSQFAMMETVISAITDEFPHVLRRNKGWFTLFCCAVCCACGLSMCTLGGIWVMTLMDWYTAKYALMFVALCEIIAVIWIYRLPNFLDDVDLMLGFRPNIYWKATWTVITPIIILFIIVTSAITNTPAYYGDYVFPDWVQGIGWAMVGLPIVLVLGTMLIQIIRYKGIRAAIRPTAEWGPANPEDRTGKYAPSIQYNGGPDYMMDKLHPESGYVAEPYAMDNPVFESETHKTGIPNGSAIEEDKTRL